MTVRTDLEPHFEGTFHVTTELRYAVDGYWSEAYGCYVPPARFVTGVVGPIDAPRPGLIDTEIEGDES